MEDIDLDDIYCFARLPKNPYDWWEANPEMGFRSPFAEFKEKGEESALVMSAIYMMYDPKSSARNSGSNEIDIKRDISKNLLDNEDYDWSQHGKLIRAYEKMCKTKIEKELDSWFLQLQERNQYVNDLDWEQNSKEKEELLLKNDAHFEKYRGIVAILKEERQERLAHGDYTKSRLEARSSE